MPAVRSLINRSVFPVSGTMSSNKAPKGLNTSRTINKKAIMLRIPGPSDLERAAEDAVKESSGTLSSANSTDGVPHYDDRKDLLKDPFPVKCSEDGGEESIVLSEDDLSQNSNGSRCVASSEEFNLDENPSVPQNVSPEINQAKESSEMAQAQGDVCDTGKETAPGSVVESEIVPVLKRKDSSKDKSRLSSSGRSVSVSEPTETRSSGKDARARGDSKTSSVSSVLSDDSKPDDDSSTMSTTSQSSPSAMSKRRISFPADSVLTAVIQDGDTPELLRILTGRHGPGLVQRRGSGGVMMGVDVCQTNHVGLTALHHAVLANNLDAAKLLLCHGADVNAQDVHGFSPLHTAAACGFLPLTSLLLLFGADVFSQTPENELPIDVAKELRITRVLSAEMIRLVHQEMWMTSAVRARMEDLWLLVRKVLAIVLLFLVHAMLFLRTQWNRRHRKSE